MWNRNFNYFLPNISKSALDNECAFAFDLIGSRSSVFPHSCSIFPYIRFYYYNLFMLFPSDTCFRLRHSLAPFINKPEIPSTGKASLQIN